MRRASSPRISSDQDMRIRSLSLLCELGYFQAMKVSFNACGGRGSRGASHTKKIGSLPALPTQ